MSASKIARRYARALSELCDADGDHATIGKQIDGFASTLTGSAELQGALKNPTVPLDQKQSIVGAIADKLGLQTTTRNFLLVMLEHGRIDCVDEVAEAFQAIVDVTARRVRATVTSAVPMSPGDVERVQTALGRLTGNIVTLDARVESNLIGGAQVQIGNLVLDSSIRSHLEKLRDRLVH